MHDSGHVRQGESLFGPGGEHRPIYVSSFFEGASMALIEGDDKFIWFPGEGRMCRFNLQSDPNETIALDVEEDTARIVRHRLAAFSAYQKKVLRSMSSPWPVGESADRDRVTRDAPLTYNPM